MHEVFEEKYISKVSILELSMEGVEGYGKSIGFREGSKGQYILFPPVILLVSNLGLVPHIN